MLLLSLLPNFEVLESFSALYQEFLGSTVLLMNLLHALCIFPVELVKCELRVYDGENLE